jgi:hypothetical protein
MSLGNHLRFLLSGLSLVPLLFLAGCFGSGGGGSGALNTITSAVQDLTVDPDGATTVITFASTRRLAPATAASFAADGGQTAQAVSVNGDTATITWDQRVSPSHRVRAVGLSGVDSAFHAVATSDAAAPTFAITSATQNPNLGGDTISVAFSGPRVVETQAEDPANWILTTDGQALDLAGSVLVLDTNAQTLELTLGATANLHASFTLAAASVHSVADVALSATPVAGNATGDTTPPTLVSANQDLTQDEYGRVVDFTFSEAMDPVFSIALSHFVVSLPDIATTVEQPAEDVLRVTFNNPIVPGYDTVTLQGLVDLHGNPFPDTVQAISQPNPVVNAFDGDVLAVTVANAGGDYVQARTTQAFDPDSAVDPAKWSLSVAGSAVDLTQQTLSYDLLSKTLTIALSLDLVNGDSFTLQGLSVLDVDGQPFVLSQTRTVAGETTPPSATGARQNRTTDPTGMTVDVQMSEDVGQASAETLANWASSGGQTLLSATLQPGLDLVRLVFDGAMVPGDVTLSVQAVQDLAGNPMALQAGIALTSTDTTPPSVQSFWANARAGANNDVVELVFDDDMVPADVTDASRWTLQSPVGTARSTAGASIEYTDPVRRARLKLVNGVNLRRGDDFSISLSGVRDLGGNALSSAALTALVTAETTLPTVHTVWRPSASSDQLEVRFSEPCDLLTDLYQPVSNPAGTRYVLRDSSGIQRGLATAATSLDDGLGALVSFGIVVDPSDTLDVLGPTDLVGNPLFPALLLPTVAEDPSAPGLAPGMSEYVSVSGEENDQITVKFDRPVSPWTITDHVHYTPTGPTTVLKRTLELTFDGVDTVVVPLRSNPTDYDLLTGSGYDLEIDGILSAQGVPMSGPQSETGIVVSGDSIGPGVQADKVRIDPATANALLVEFREAVAPPSATDLSSYLYDGVNAPVAAQLLGQRGVRLAFALAPQVGHSLTISVSDRAGNPSGLLLRTVTAADTSGPLVSSVQGVIREGWGGDEVLVTFDEPVTGTTALNSANYAVQSGASVRSLSGASLSYSSGTSVVHIRLAGGQDLQAGVPVNVTISGVQDFSGNPMSAAVQVGGPTSGDSTPPAFANAFVNLRADANGAVVDVLFSEDVDPTFAANPLNWGASGGVTVLSVSMQERNHARITLSGPLAAAGTLQMTGLPDVAGNASGTISVDPEE